MLNYNQALKNLKKYDKKRQHEIIGNIIYTYKIALQNIYKEIGYNVEVNISIKHLD